MSHYIETRSNRYHSVQKLYAGDANKRVEFANWFLRQPKNAHEWLIATDEAWFTLTEKPNRQNNQYWAVEPPDYDTEVPLHDKKFMVWLASNFRYEVPRSLRFRRDSEEGQLLTKNTIFFKMESHLMRLIKYKNG